MPIWPSGRRKESVRNISGNHLPPDVDKIKNQIKYRKEIESKIRVVKERQEELQRILRSKKDITTKSLWHTVDERKRRRKGKRI